MYEEITDDFTPNIKTLGSCYADAADELITPPESVRIPGMPKLDDLLGGLRPNEFTILCGATGSGKTTLLANLSLELMNQRTPHYVASVETGHTDFIKRVISADIGQDWNTGDPVEMEKVRDYMIHRRMDFESLPMVLSLYDNRIKVETLMKEIEYSYEHHGIKICLLDNLNFFMEVTNSRDQIVEMDRVTHEFIMFCKRTPVHIVMVMHPRKTDNGRVLSEFDIKGSSTAVQEAHNVLLFNRPDLTRTGALHSERELKLAKSRRRGKHTGKTLVLSSVESVKYTEKELLGWD